MKKRAGPDQVRKCQKDFNSPLADWLQNNLRYFFDKPPNDPSHESVAWLMAVRDCGRIMGYYLENCPAGNSWKDYTKLQNLIDKYNNNVLDGSRH